MKKINVFYATVILAVTSLVTYKLIKKGNIKVARQFRPSNCLGENKTFKTNLNVEEIEDRKYTILKQYSHQEVKQPNN